MAVVAEHLPVPVTGRPRLHVVEDHAGIRTRPRPHRRAAGVYRRRRATVALMLVVTIWAAAAAVRAWSSSPVPGPSGEAVLVVADGQTLWHLALPYAPTDADPQTWVARVAAHNDVDPLALRPGTVIRVPFRDP